MSAWKDFDKCKPPRPANAGEDFCYLCEVSGLKYTRYAVLRYDSDGYWWIYALPMLAGVFDGGWVGLPDGVEILRWKKI